MLLLNAARAAAYLREKSKGHPILSSGEVPADIGELMQNDLDQENERLVRQGTKPKKIYWFAMASTASYILATLIFLPRWWKLLAIAGLPVGSYFCYLSLKYQAPVTVQIAIELTRTYKGLQNIGNSCYMYLSTYLAILL